MKRLLILLVSFNISSSLFSQSTENNFTDTADAKLMQAVVVNSYDQNRKLVDVAAAVSYVGQNQLNRFSNNSILAAVNTNPGVRMEERSPGSYRLNIRGSSFRSPFGVRDVKVYFNDIPLTDPGGNTYLNQLGFYNFQSLEIIKGPAGSMYGAGTGGAVLIHSMPSAWKPGLDLSYTAASFANHHLNAVARTGKPDAQTVFGYSHQSSDGYREQTRMRRDVASWESRLKLNERQTINAFILYSDLYYQTPGALTRAEFTSDPRQARPAAGSNPSAIQNKAAIWQKTFTAGISNKYRLNTGWQNTTAVYGAYTDFTNPGIRVYEKRKEPHFGGRTVFQYNKEQDQNKWQVNLGAEAQKGFFNVKDYRNRLGEIDTLQTDDDIDNWLYSLFAQADLKLKETWTVTLGASFNRSYVSFTRLSKRPVIKQEQTFDAKLAPRIAILKKLNKDVSIYASAAKGFSNPTVSELLRSNGVIGNNLQPGDGLDYEAGAKGGLLESKLQFDLNFFFFNLKNTIVQRIDTAGVFFYVNAGSTKQNGFEANLQYDLVDNPGKFIERIKPWISYTLHDFTYNDFKQVNNDFSGKKLPGVAKQFVAAGLDVNTKNEIYINLTYTYSDPTQLNDANTDQSTSYNLLNARLGCKRINLKAMTLDLFAGADNIFDTKYSLGNDINAAAGRYFNAAPTINYYVGASLHF